MSILCSILGHKRGMKTLMDGTTNFRFIEINLIGPTESDRRWVHLCDRCKLLYWEVKKDDPIPLNPPVPAPTQAGPVYAPIPSSISGPSNLAFPAPPAAVNGLTLNWKSSHTTNVQVLSRVVPEETPPEYVTNPENFKMVRTWKDKL